MIWLCLIPPSPPLLIPTFPLHTTPFKPDIIACLNSDIRLFPLPSHFPFPRLLHPFPISLYFPIHACITTLYYICNVYSVTYWSTQPSSRISSQSFHFRNTIAWTNSQGAIHCDTYSLHEFGERAVQWNKTNCGRLPPEFFNHKKSYQKTTEAKWLQRQESILSQLTWICHSFWSASNFQCSLYLQQVKGQTF